MVACRSCGRNIASGTIRCSQCSSPYHLSCSHRYKISPEGVFNVCCGDTRIFGSNNRFAGNIGGGIGGLNNQGNNQFSMRTRNNTNKRPLNRNPVITQLSNQQQQQQQKNNQQQQQQQQKEQNQDSDGMRYGKVQKTTATMVIEDKPVIIDAEPDCADTLIIQEEDYNENDNDDFDNNDDSGEVQVIIESVNNSTTNVDQSSIPIIDLNNDTNNKITLETVWQGISSLQSSISNISNSLDTVSTQLNTFDPRINELEATLNTIKAKTTNFENVQNDVSGLRTDLERITKELENLKKNEPPKDLKLPEILMEIKEREVKAKNILIYNVREDNLRISQDYSTVADINKFNALVAARDCSRAREVLDKIPNIDLDDLRCRRLGKENPNMCRPLRVTLSNKEDVITIMKRRALIHKPFVVKTDLTKHQQLKIKDLKVEIDKINVNKDNPTMTIKFVNGEPSLIPIRRNLLKNE